MNNKIALVNRDLHNKLFQNKGQLLEDDPPKIYRRHPLPPQIMLKNMVRKGLTNTQNQFLSRPKTAASNFTYTHQGKNSMTHLRPSRMSELRKGSSVKKNEIDSQSHVDFNMNVQHPQQFEQFEQILNKMKWQRDQEGVRKKVKLEKYCQKKFNYAWKKYNIPK